MWYLIIIALLFFVFIIAVSIIWGHRLKGSPKVLLLHYLRIKGLSAGDSPSQGFEKLLKLIEANGLSVGTLAECLRDRTKVAVTFDDGYESLMALIPILERQNLPITVFIPTAYIGKLNDWDHWFAKGRRRHLNEYQIRELAKCGVQFGSHGHSHRDLTTLSVDEIRTDLALSKAVLSKLTCQEVVSLAYPFGRSNRNVQSVAKQLGLTMQFASSSLAMPGESIGRIPVTGFDSKFTLGAKLRGGVVAGIEALKAHTVSRFSHLTPVVRSTSGAN